MKKLDYLWVMLLALIVSFATVACDEDDEGSSSLPTELVGSWENEGVKITFNSNGTGVINEYGYIANFTCSYASDANLLTVYFSDEEGDYTEQYRISFSGENQLVMVDMEDGEELIFYREGTSTGGEDGDDSGNPDEDLDHEGGLTNGEDYDLSVPVDLPAMSDAYPEVSGEYEIANTDCGYEFIELMGDGNYLVKKTDMYLANQKTAKNKKFISFPVKNKVLTRDASISDSQLVYGGYQKISDDVYYLDGFGTLTVTERNDDGNITSFVLTSNEGVTVDLTVNKKEQIDDNTGNGANLCRNWTAVEERCTYSINGNKMYDAVHSIAEDQVYVFKNKLGIDWRDEDIFDTGDIALQKVLFTSNGTYLMFFKNDPMELSYWRWEDKSSGIIFAYDIYQGEIDGATARVVFSGNYLYVMEEFAEYYDGQYIESVYTSVLRCN